ncbi:MAG: M23 family metallopeptidase [Desulfobacteraceae bacterium]|nr:MAG: M23 family metallopeptidase [Desulfobacteraceae bacterium]
MARKISVIIIGASESKIRHFGISINKLCTLAVAMVVVLGFVVYGAVGYLMHRSQLEAKRQMQAQFTQQDEELALQREQIIRFASAINGLKERMLSLTQLEDRVRVLANLDSQGREGIFGIGGSAPDDLNPDVELKEKQNELIEDMRRQIRLLESASQKQHHVFSDLLAQLEEKRSVMACTPSIWPAEGLVTSSFDYRKSPFTGKREFHKGIDVANRDGTPIAATADGIVSYVGHNGSLGQLLVIDHGYGIITRYAHLQKILKKRGERVQKGDAIALMGNTGRSTGPHLHYEVRVNGLPVNPQKYILD